MTRVIAITGASAGIGRATALRLTRDGASLVLCARRRERLDLVTSEVVRAGGQALPVVADVANEAAVNSLVAQGVERFGHLDVMMCNAGFGIYGAVDGIAPERMRRLLEVNYLGTYHAVRAALPMFRRQGSGHLIVVASSGGRRGVPYTGAYAATKFAQVGLAECLRAELSGSGIHVSVVFPISTQTEFFDVMRKESGFSPRAIGPQQSADAVAEAVARTIARPRPEVYPYRKARALVLLNAVAPGWCDRLVHRWRRHSVP